MFPSAIGRWLACAIGAGLLASPAALGAAPHSVLPGETLWSISAANNLTTRTVAIYNGVPESAQLRVGTTIYVPTVEEGAAALASGAPAVAPPATNGAPGETVPTGTLAESATTTTVPAPGMGQVPSPYGQLQLVPAAADAWNAMRAEASSVYGIDIYPAGPVSAYRTYEQQSELYRAFLAGYGAPANPPGTSSHESGTAIDVQTPEMRWVIDQIGSKHGWGKVHAPGEWWHVDYLGG
jgi:D-alanyl-D-alanine carboxypeptidase/LysM domain